MSQMSQLSLNTSRNVQRSLSLIGTAATAMAATIVASLTATIAKSEDFTYAMSQMAEKTGNSVDMVSKLAYNAKLAGVPVDSLKMALERLGKTAGAANSGNKEAVAAYASLGIHAKELNGPMKQTGDLFVQVGKSLDGMSESENKLRLEQVLLGKSGAELAPLLKQLASGFDTASEQAELFGVVIGDKSAAQAKKLHESMTQLESVALGFSLRLLSGVAPALDTVAQKMVNFATSSNGMKTVDSIASHLASAVTGLGDAFQFLSEHTTAVKRTLEGVAALQVGSILVPLIAGGAKAGMTFSSLGGQILLFAGKASGISQLGKVFTPMIVGAGQTVGAYLSLAKSEGVLATGALAVSDAFKVLRTSMLANPYVIVAAGVALVGTKFYEVSSAAKASEVDGGKWADVWNGGILGVKNNIEVLLASFKRLRGEALSDKDKAAITRGFNGEDSQSLIQRAGRNRRGMSDDLWSKIHAGDLKPEFSQTAPKKDAPALVGVPKPEKIDQLKLKMAELAASAAAAQQTLADAGKGVDFQRADDITKEYTKTVIELAAHLKTQHKTLSDAERAAIRSSIATRVNDESQAKFRNEVVLSTQQILAQADAQGILTAAIGQGAAAMRTAQVESEFKSKNAGQSQEWLKANQGLINQQKAARMTELSAGDAHTDVTALDSLKQQVSVQTLLNAAILAGRDATNQAHLASEKAAITKAFRDRGDTDQSALDAQLAETERLFNLQQSGGDLQKAAAMDAARLYNDEAAAIRNAAAAAREAGQAINQMQLKAADKAAWDTYLSSVDKAALAVGGLSDGASVFFQQMSRDTVSAAQQMHDLLGGAFGDLNSTLEKLVTTKTKTFADFTREVKSNFSDMFRGISGSLAALGIQKLESGLAGGLMKSLGIGAKSDPTVTAINGTNQRLDVLIGLAGGKAVTSLASTVGVVSGTAKTSGSWLSGSASKVLGGIGGLFGGGKALGGDVMADVSYNVGEMGIEKFTPSVNGKITPNKDMGRSGPLIGHIDARGANDPAQTEAAIHRAMGSYGPMIVQAAVQRVTQNRQRSPSSVS